MISKSAQPVRLLASWGLCAALILFHAPATCHAEEITIDVAPNTLNLQSNGKIVTVHTDIAYGSVDVSSVYINGIAIASWKADNRGNFVAKFSMEEVKQLDGLIIGDYNTLQLVGLTTDGEPFWGEQDIMVIEVIPSHS
jgi:hypothetical protein